MARSPTKELERIEALHKRGVISSRQAEKMKYEVIEGNKSKPSNKKTSNTLEDFFSGVLGLLIIAGIVWYFYDPDDTEQNPPKVEKTSQKQCEQIAKDNGYIVGMNIICPSYIPETKLYFQEYAENNHCPINIKHWESLGESTKNMVIKKYMESTNKEEFCKSQITYINKVIQKYK